MGRGWGEGRFLTRFNFDVDELGSHHETTGIYLFVFSVFTWSGASGTDFWVDPKEQLVMVFMSAGPGSIRWHYRRLINALVYQSIVD